MDIIIAWSLVHVCLISQLPFEAQFRRKKGSYTEGMERTSSIAGVCTGRSFRILSGPTPIIFLRSDVSSVPDQSSTFYYYSPNVARYIRM
jgi:hypothetical protein